jgi:restriction endonuclease S subunit
VIQERTSAWAFTTIGDIVDVFDSIRIPLNSRQRAERQGPYPYYGASGVIDSVDDFLFNGEYVLVAEDGENLNSRKLPVAFMARGEFWVNNHAHIIKGRPELADDRYLIAWFANANISGYITGAAQPKLSQANLRRIKLQLPPLPLQRKIASILSAYDDLIENNTRRIAILEEMAQSIYREWFVNFRFPGFEDVKLVDSPLGMIPEGWEVVSTRDAIDIKPRTHVPKEGEKPFVSMGAVPTNTMLIDEAEIESRTKNSGSKFKNGDTLFARITPCLENGKTAFVNFLPSDEDVACGSTEFIVLRSETVIPEFVYLLARSDEFRDIAIKSMSGATGRQRVREACFDQFYFAHPTATLLEQFQDVANPLFRSVFTLAKKNHNLRTTRDLLLPKLISGKLDVEDLDINVSKPLEELQETTA